MGVIVIETINEEQSETVKAILKALKVRFTATEDISESKIIAESVAQGYKEMLDAKAGKIKARDARDLFDEL
ncbi:hypothetical protein KIH41_13310 [Litoribacter ruber]|uniref:Uncharacterized protein n=1 Tax=Litoribacter ruber TaxID=702568 RepID=A0AAP2CFP2_9BACT|nr:MULTISPECIES: hypothetical protein [Litoribacter]MBS9523743.1 hypothetical protein [Litoribacter alkaliphilus]MBT0812258.1 hypothetical protein [Litoribacter ruber]